MTKDLILFHSNCEEILRLREAMTRGTEQLQIKNCAEGGIRVLSVQQIADGVRVASREYPLSKVELFGSYASGKNTPQSDVDLIVEFSQPRVSLLTINSMKYRMEELLGTEVDIIHGPLPENSMIEVDRRIPLYGA